LTPAREKIVLWKVTFDGNGLGQFTN